MGGSKYISPIHCTPKDLFHSSEENLHTELDLPGGRVCVQNLPRVAKRSLIRDVGCEDGSVRQAEIRMVQDVEEFRAKLQLSGLAQERQSRILVQREVPRPQSGPSQHVAA